MPKSTDVSSNSPIIHSVVVAAGVGKRFGGDLPKQYTKIHGKTVLEHSIAALSQLPQLSKSYVVISEDDTIAKTLQFAMPITWVTGGAERMHSVINGVTAIITQLQTCSFDVSNLLDHTVKGFDNHWVLIHDAARPCVKPADIAKLIALVTACDNKQSSGGILAVPVRDTVKQIKQQSDQLVAEQTIDRSRLWLAQTPQLFPLVKLYHYLNQAIEQNIAFTDEASLFEHFANYHQNGEYPLLVEGSHSNIKLTYPEDLAFAAVFLTKQ